MLTSLFVNLQQLSTTDIAFIGAIAAVLAAIIAAAASIAAALVTGWFERRNALLVEMRQHSRTAFADLQRELDLEIKILVQYSYPDNPAVRTAGIEILRDTGPVKTITASWNKRLEEAYAHKRYCRQRTKHLLNSLAPDLPVEEVDSFRRLYVMNYAQTCWKFLFELERYYFQRATYWPVMKYVRALQRRREKKILTNMKNK